MSRGQQPVIRFDCVTIFPEMFAAVTQSGITRRALEEQRWAWQGWNPRDFADNAWRRVDDRPFGGGPGMLMQPGPLEKAINAAKAQQREVGLAKSRVIYLSPQGAPLTELSHSSATHIEVAQSASTWQAPPTPLVRQTPPAHAPLRQSSVTRQAAPAPPAAHT